MSVAFDAVGPDAAGAGGASPVSPVTWTHVCTGANLALFVGICVDVSDDTTVNVTGVTYNTVAMTEVLRRHANDGTVGYASLWVLAAPASGSHTVSVTFTGSPANLEAGSVSFTGTDQVTPYAHQTSAVGNTNAPTVNVTSAVGNAVVDLVVSGAGVSSSGQTSRWIKNLGGVAAGGNGAQSTAAGAASVTMSYTLAGVDFWALIGVDVVANTSGVGDDVLIRYGSMLATSGSGLIMAAFADAIPPGAVVGPGLYQWYSENIAND